MNSILINSLMENRLKDFNLNRKIVHKKSLFSANFIDLIFPKFSIINNCLLINTTRSDIDLQFISDHFGSLSAYEDFANHVHIIDICNVSITEQLQILFTLKENWKQVLKCAFPDKEFCIALFCDFTRKANTIIRVSMLRNNEPDLYDYEFIENTKNIGLYVEKFG